MDRTRKHIIFTGTVQGVGFRYRAKHIAQALGLTGWVRNTWDDKVEMEIQGTETSIQKLLELLQNQSFIYIEGIEIEELPLQEEGSFHIRG